MAYNETSRRKLKTPEPGNSPNLCADLRLLVEALDNDAETGQGKESSRPAASIRGRLWMITGDTAEKTGLLSWDTGTKWVTLNGNVKEVATVKAELTALKESSVTASSTSAYVTDESWGEGVILSATRPAFVTLTGGLLPAASASEAEATVYVGSVALPGQVGVLRVFLPGGATGQTTWSALSFFVPAGKAYWVQTRAAFSVHKRAYVLL